MLCYVILEQNGEVYSCLLFIYYLVCCLLQLDLEDVGPLKKIRVETNGKGSRPAWYLEKVGSI